MRFLQLAAFGFLAGTTVEGNETTANAGLLDQRAAMRWVQQYIHLFGGDANNVTVVGQDTGAGSIMLHTAWLSGRNATENGLFKSAVAQRPWPLIVPTPQRRSSFDALLSAARVTSVEELRALPMDSDILMRANAQAGRSAPVNTVNFGAYCHHEVPQVTGVIACFGESRI